MGLRNRAIFWFFVYGFLVFFPLFIAATNQPPGDRAAIVEISVACGFIGLAMLALEFALISHLRPVALPFGMDALIQFHRELGTMALVFVLAHPILLFINGLPLSTFKSLWWNSCDTTRCDCINLYAAHRRSVIWAETIEIQVRILAADPRLAICRGFCHCNLAHGKGRPLFQYSGHARYLVFVCHLTNRLTALVPPGSTDPVVAQTLGHQREQG